MIGGSRSSAKSAKWASNSGRPCPTHAEVLDRFDRLAVAFHLQVIGHCLWRLDRGELPYRAALEAEATALRARL